MSLESWLRRLLSFRLDLKWLATGRQLAVTQMPTCIVFEYDSGCHGFIRQAPSSVEPFEAGKSLQKSFSSIDVIL